MPISGDEPISEPKGPAHVPPHQDRLLGADGIVQGDPSDPEARFKRKMAETRKALLTKFDYPQSSQPLAGKTDLIEPHHVEPTLRALKPGGKVAIEQRQDRTYLTPGQGAVVTLRVTINDGPVPIEVTRAELVKEAQGNAPPQVVGTVTLHDDGKAPDTAANDGTWTATLDPLADPKPTGLTLFVDVKADGEEGTVVWQFVQTSDPPARFTQQARVALESGSVAFYVGISVERAGRYDIVGRVYDSTNAPIAYLRFQEQLGTDATEVRLTAFGKLLLDTEAVPPLVLKDVEGQRDLIGQYPDREMMEGWAGDVQTPAYDPRVFSDAPYEDPNKQKRLQALDQATKEGLENIRGHAAPPTLPTTPPPDK